MHLHSIIGPFAQKTSHACCRRYEYSTTIPFWSELESMLTQYHGLLEDREKLNKKISKLAHENDDLKSNLDSLLQQDINNELIVPPLK